MLLPLAPKKDGIAKAVQVKFGGLNRGLGAADGELADMRNLTGGHAPLLATREQRQRVMLDDGGGSPAPVSALSSHDELCWVSGGGFYYGGARAGTAAEGGAPKIFCSMGAYIVILPDKLYYNTWSGEFGALEASWGGAQLTFMNGVIFEEPAEANTIQAPGVDWGALFRPGDAVTIAGAMWRPVNNKTAVIREIDGDKLRFSEFCFQLGGADGDLPYTEVGSLTVSRGVPDMDFLCENENRLWGCHGNTIYASKLGDIFNWNVFEMLDTDSYAVDVGSPGSFTACFAFLGHPVFFKEDIIYKVFGTLPENFQVTPSASLGVMEGCHGSLAVANETLYYLSRAGVVAYAGGIPRPVSAAFGTERFESAVAGGDGLKYYVSMRRAGESGEGGHLLYVYDPMHGTWHIEDGTRATYFTRWRGGLYFLNGNSDVWRIGQGPGEGAAAYFALEPEGAFAWHAEFADFIDSDPDRKGLSKLQARIEPDEGADALVFYKIDSEPEWRLVETRIIPGVKRSYYMPVIPERADHYRLMICGTGGCKVYSLSRERYSGSALQNFG